MVSMVRNDCIYVLKTVTDLDPNEDQLGQPLIQDAISTQAHQDLEMQSTSAGYVIPSRPLLCWAVHHDFATVPWAIDALSVTYANQL